MSISASPKAASSWALSPWQGSSAPNGWLPSKGPTHQKTLGNVFAQFFCHLINVDPQPMNSIQPLRLTAENFKSVKSLILITIVFWNTNLDENQGRLPSFSMRTLLKRSRKSNQDSQHQHQRHSDRALPWYQC